MIDGLVIVLTNVIFLEDSLQKPVIGSTRVPWTNVPVKFPSVSIEVMFNWSEYALAITSQDPPTDAACDVAENTNVHKESKVQKHSARNFPVIILFPFMIVLLLRFRCEV